MSGKVNIKILICVNFFDNFFSNNLLTKVKIAFFMGVIIVDGDKIRV